ncbi:hypothetical protein NA57DRAFT_52040 [Rhizodiscina lignyota]|uniref:Peptidase S8/S53 domain-containing protein n=1 Tax=Rhizodiscina lignyota TaxID=1504668 RepID=A0A9P4INH5_9PEZI|nr:hypothetical protein NA57DRAFT_52040 [Rhizodiscina lignyota]
MLRYLLTLLAFILLIASQAVSQATLEERLTSSAPSSAPSTFSTIYSSSTAESETSSKSKRAPVDNPHPHYVDLSERPVAPQHLQLLCQPSGKPLEPGYVFPKSNGEGTTIFVIDAGFNVDNEDYTARPGGPPQQYIVPNEITLKDVHDKELWEPKSIHDNFGKLKETSEGTYASGHGTLMASVAAGTIHGSASGAKLYLIKMMGDVKNPDFGKEGNKNPKIMTYNSLNGFEAAFAHIRDVVQAKPDVYRKRSVVVLTSSFEKSECDPDELQQKLKVLFDELANEGVIIVLSAGNSGNQEQEDFVDNWFPQTLETDKNPIVIVGGVSIEGYLNPITTPTRDGAKSGTITVYALSRKVWGASNNPWALSGPKSQKYGAATSPATAVVVSSGYQFKPHVDSQLQSRQGGMIATWLTVAADKPDVWDPSWSPLEHAMKMKELLKEHAYQRTDEVEIMDGMALRPHYPKPKELKVAYNGVFYGVCTNNPDKNLIIARSATDNTTGNSFSNDTTTIMSHGTWIESALKAIGELACTPA